MLALFSLPQASTVAGDVDNLFTFLTVFSVISFILVIAALAYFIIKYNRNSSDPDKTPIIHGHPLMEGAVMVLLFVIVMVIFAWGWVDYKKMIAIAPNALEVNVKARKWQWDFEYTNGRSIPKILVVSKDQPVTLIMSSTDVLHSFFVPAFRVKQDVLPDHFTKISFTPTMTGVFQVYCTEYCGTDHSNMMAAVVVKEKKDYDLWQKSWELKKQLGENVANDFDLLSKQIEKEDPSIKLISPAGLEIAAAAMASSDSSNPANQDSPATRGAKVFATKGCVACHSVNGQVMVGPTLKGVFGHEVELLDGTKVSADENYIRESLMDPSAKIVKGFTSPSVMPTYRGTLADDEVSDLISYIKSLK